ncbi:HlyD family type I secretion periplasmic adaptor subunit [Hydrogenophaga electricum]|uniref:Membrane fusion protein (MFP) family protein n=1 Tax=Hydrogenophaga electricum TaxID=1230953 RepID=A0ABQ6C0R5_9BURK|nr:HlyD family type I secretion periplasmic adaptor subunit [Hydrogenophaga electricum]GLS13354.1 HlyD family type I secretion periplasmic adaptor subunit [Hydrogenophaga electricum]
MGVRIRLQAAHDLFKRYTAVWRQAWQLRREMTPAERLEHEAAFLPAALALQETPVSPLPRVAMWLLVMFALLALLWSVWGRIDVVATAQGKFIPNDRTKVVQPFETASVKRIHVADGQAVKAGDLLVELDGESAGADVERLGLELEAALLQVSRGEAMLQWLDGQADAVLARPPEVSEAAYLEGQRHFAGQAGEYAAKRARIAAEVAQREAERQSTLAGVRKLEQTLPIADQRAQNYRNLVAKNFVSKHGYLDREQIRIEQQADLNSQRSRVQELEAALQQARTRGQELQAETRRLSLDSIDEGRQRAAALRQEFRKATARLGLMRLVAPVDGTVQQLAIHTEGGVVTPAQALMVIVPHGANLEVEAFLENKDIGFVHEGQEAEIKVETFPYTKHGMAHAVVKSVSRDAINDEKRGLVYVTRLQLVRSDIRANDRSVELVPGMAVSVEIKTGSRRVIEYFLSPLIRGAQESMRER